MSNLIKRLTVLSLVTALTVSSSPALASATDVSAEDASAEAVPAAAESRSAQSDSITVEAVNAAAGLYSINISGIPSDGSISAVKVPIWSEVNGQDDIVWYDAANIGNGQWKADFSMANHNYSEGIYTIHVYAIPQSGDLTFVTNSSFTPQKPSTNALSSQVSGNTLTVKLYAPSVASGSIQSVFFPVWGEENGQNDCIWYNAEFKDGAWTAVIDLNNHKEYGSYSIHAYAQTSAGSLEFLTNGFAYIAVPSAPNLTVSDRNSDEGSYTISTGEIHSAFAISRVLVPTWTEKNGQDDIVWHTAEKSGSGYSVTINSSEHNYESGRYISHVYIEDEIGLHALSAIAEDVTVTNKVALTAKHIASKSQLEITLSGYRRSSDDIHFAVWGEANGQNDLVWYKAEKSGSNYTYTVDLSNHPESGTFNIHVYDLAQKDAIFVTAAKTEVTGLTIDNAKVEVTSLDSVQGTVSLKITGISSAKSVLVPVWGDAGGQNDIVWYQASQTDNSTWTATVNLSQHNEIGNYQVHAYAADNFDNLTFAGNTNFSIPQIFTVADKASSDGTYNVTFSTTDATITKIDFAAWSKKDQSDLAWYSMSRSGNTFTSAIDLKNHSYNSGVYTIHFYVIHSDGSQEFGGALTANLESVRIYQNPAGYYQIQDSISLGGGGYNLSAGYEGLKVAKVLQYFGYNYIGMGGAYYGSAVANSVARFQRNHGLVATGVVDLKTWLTMGFSEYDWYNLGAYVSPLKVTRSSTRSEHIEAMISTAYSYLGNPYVIGASGAPGLGIDCSGLVMQALYSAGIDTSPINPVRHASPGYEYESANMFLSSKFLHVPYSQRQRGDLIFYQNSRGAVIHVAIYLGNNQVIESWPNQVVIWPVQNYQRSNIKGVVRPFI